MTVNILTHPKFVRQMKRFAKKYRSLGSDFADFLKTFTKIHSKELIWAVANASPVWLLPPKGKVRVEE